MDLALSPIEQQTIEFDPAQYTDRYRERLEQMLEKKEPVSQAEFDGAAAAMDIIEALRLSLKDAKKRSA